MSAATPTPHPPRPPGPRALRPRTDGGLTSPDELAHKVEVQQPGHYRGVSRKVDVHPAVFVAGTRAALAEHVEVEKPAPVVRARRRHAGVMPCHAGPFHGLSHVAAETHRAVGGALAEDLDLAGEFVAAFQSTLPVRARSAGRPGGGGGSGVNVTANISENHTAFFNMRTINSQIICLC